MANGNRTDPYNSYNFHVELDGISSASFREASGLDSTVDVMEYREGGDSAVRKLPGQTRYSNIVLKRGVTDSMELHQWHLDATQGNVQRKTGSVVLIDRNGSEKARWNFTNAWPTKWTGPAFNAEGKDVAIETLELAHEGLTRIQL